MLNWAILGTGFISNEVAAAIKKSGGSQILAIAGRNQTACEVMQNRFNIARIYDGYETVFEDPDIDVIYIGLPSHIHHTMTRRAAKNGKAVLSEKSLTTNMKDAHTLADTVRSNDVFFAEGLMYLAHPVIKKFSGILSSGQLGNLRSVSGYYAAAIADLVNPAGKGTLYNLGCYPASLLQLTVQTMCGVDAFRARKLGGFGNKSEENGNICDAAVNVRFDNGVLATLQSTDSYGMTYGFSVMADEGKLTFRTNPWLPNAGRNHIEWNGYDGTHKDIYIDDDHDAFYHQVKMVEEAIASGRKEAPRPSPRLSDSMEIMEFLTDWEASCS